MLKLYNLLLGLVFLSMPVVADTTGKGKIIFTQGHIVPSCRTVQHKENITGIIRNFRIQDIPNDNVQSIVLSALMANRDVAIFYDQNTTSGCGAEPRITYVSVY